MLSFETLLTVLSFIEKGPFAVIDCSRNFNTDYSTASSIEETSKKMIKYNSFHTDRIATTTTTTTSISFPGLYELIFKRIPNDAIYTENDRQTYKHILLSTNAHKRHHNA
ncbi:hypothetical protein ALC57_18106 [Trachymyrmex cornetzi]|uniref:DUF8207 domain-containing protein n=1 Tax=Trachymyrmex cornetzi TaxID=471704 RepID=A0A151ISC8_9HYME|nr:hypothetical protein ALC57_18106 [Trachymyrmex cornetzi]